MSMSMAINFPWGGDLRSLQFLDEELDRRKVEE
jgi:hypothetical protein